MIVVFFQQRTYSGFKELLNRDFLLSSHLSSQKYKNDAVGKLLFQGAWLVTTQTNAEKCTPRKQTKTLKPQRPSGGFFSLGRENGEEEEVEKLEEEKIC